MSKQYDIIIVGSGPGGYVAGIRASQLGLSVAIIEKEHLGGICLNWGCIPTKSLLRSAEINHLLHNLEEFGFKAEKISYDLEKIIQRSRGIAKQLSNGIKHLMKKNKIEIYEGHGFIKNNEKVIIKNKDNSTIELSTKHIIIATGAKARELPHIKVDHKNIITYKEAMIPKSLPKKLLIIGSGAIGMEFASFYSNMGSEVVVVEIQNKILPAEDEEISAMAQKIFEKQGIRILVSTNIEKIKVNDKTINVTLKLPNNIENLSFDQVIQAVGIIGNTENIGLENTKVKVEKGQIVTDSYMRTDHKGIYAIGDVTGGPWLAHKASHEGIICVENIAGLQVKPLKKEMIPGCTYCRPQIASVGFTEQQAKDKGFEVKVGRFPYIANGKAITLGETEGLIKTIFNGKTGELLGAHMIGAEVTELIQGFVTAKNLEATETDLMHSIYPHPTLSEMMQESVLDAFGKVINF